MAHLSLALLGPFQILVDGKAPTSTGYDKVRALLAYLAVENTPHEREALLGLFWPNLPEQAARNNLRQVLLRLREVIGDHKADPPFLLTNRATIQWNTQANYSLDIATFTGLIDQCARHYHRSLESCGACAARLAEAVDLYRGSFLAEFFLPDCEQFEEWALLKREWLQRTVLETLSHLIIYHERRAQYTQALHFARRKLEIDSWNEETHRQLMRLYLLLNERSAALAQYEQCRHLLKEELGVEPEAETTALFLQIRNMGDAVPLLHASLAPPARRRNTLPPQLTPFVGRQQELMGLGKLLDSGETRLITLTGPGGIGKTRLALQAATEQIDCFADGVYYVPLADLSDTELVPAALATALQIDVPVTADVRSHLLNSLGDVEALLVLDNLEQLLMPPSLAANIKPGTLEALLTDILRVAPGITILATSRQRLNLQAEWVFSVAGLSVPQSHSAEASGESDAVRLFVQSARRVTGFALTPEDESHVVRICQLVEGLPLAIELAASWTRLLTCAEIAQEIERGLELFSTSLPDLSERHRSLTAVFSYSWAALTGTEQRVLRQLSVFRGGFQREAATQVAGATIPNLATLVDSSVLKYTQRGRYEFYELIRQFIEEKLAPGEDELVRHRHAAYYLALAERSETELKGADQATWVERLETEVNNIRAALGWAMDADEVVLAGRICVALDHFWITHAHHSEGKRWLEQILLRLQADDDVSAALRARVLNSIGMLACDHGDYTRAIAVYEESLALQRTLGDAAGIARVLNNLGNIYLRQNRGEQALALFEEALTNYRRLNNVWAISILLSNIGVLLCDQGDFESGAKYYLESLDLRRQQGDATGIATSLYNLADVFHRLGDDEQALIYLQESLVIFEQLHNTLAIAMIEHFWGTMLLLRGEPEVSLSHLRKSLTTFRDLNAQHYLAAVLESFAAVAGMVGQPEHGVRLLGAAETLRAHIGAELNPAELDEYTRLVTLARDTLDDEAFSAARQQGQLMVLDEAIVMASNVCPRPCT